MSNTTVVDYVIKSTARQLGVDEKEVTMDTVIPDIHHMFQFASAYLDKIVIINNLSAQYTVKRAIEEFER
ncbi:MAG: hypothetical protein WC819_03825 [Parcubacteria group bacterium]